MTVNHPFWGTMCEICFNTLEREDCAVDWRGNKWDSCKGICAIQSGIYTEDQRHLLEYIRWASEHNKLGLILQRASERGDL